MFIIPELKKVVIVPPRTASTSLRNAVRDKYPKAMILYRHGEWGLVPSGYETYTPVYVLRHPVERLHSLWRYMGAVDKERCPNAPAEWLKRVREDADRPFKDWLLYSEELFNDGDNSPDGAHYHTLFKCPAARKSAAQFLCEAKNVEIVRFGEYDDYVQKLGVSKLPWVNSAPDKDRPVVDEEMTEFLFKWHEDDLKLLTMERYK